MADQEPSRIWIERQLACIRRAGALPEGSDGRWRSFFEHLWRVRSSAPLQGSDQEILYHIDGSDELWHAPEIFEGVYEAAFYLILHFKSVADHEISEQVRVLARGFVKAKLADRDYLSKASVEDLMDLGIVGERTHLWTGGSFFPSSPQRLPT